MRPLSFALALVIWPQSALAQPHLPNRELQSQSWSGEIFQPVRYARVTFDRNGGAVVAGGWREIAAGPRMGICSVAEAFDALDADWSDPANPVLDPEGNRCGLPATARYSFGAASSNPNSFDNPGSQTFSKCRRCRAA